MKKIALLLIWTYQNVIKPIINPNNHPRCRFSPSCSNYAKEAFLTLPFLKALKVTTTRIVKCNPFGKSGFDPVPKK